MEFELFHLLIFTIPFATAYFLKAWSGKKSYLDYLITHFVFFNVALQGIMAGLTQIYNPHLVAKYLNWPFSPFIYELGFANLAIGIGALFALLLKNLTAVWTAAAIYGLFLFFAFINHILQLYFEGNFSAGNAGAVVFTDLLTPVTLALLFYLSRRNK